jgi:transposase
MAKVELSGASGKLIASSLQAARWMTRWLSGSAIMTIRARALSGDEAEELAHMARSRSLGAGLVRRAQIVQHAVQEGLSAPEIAARMGLCGATVRFWLKRFNERGLPGLEEAMRSGRPPTYTAEERSAVIKAALSRPAELDLPFASWTLDRLVAYLGTQGIGMRRSRVSEVLLAEGLKWRQEETWFGARVDPAFAEKRGPLSNSTPRRRTAA